MIKLQDILKSNKSVKEAKDFTLDRTEFYQQYYKNLSPSDFEVRKEADTIVIKIPKK